MVVVEWAMQLFVVDKNQRGDFLCDEKLDLSSFGLQTSSEDAGGWWDVRLH